ncbi:GTA-gp10 family protein [Maricaulis maris]|uniref:GTA-gp10 family protein n=1 Tax=Maricaulis maris TaxID=74318 RepID=UPI003A8F674F
MANRQRGEVELVIGERTLTLCLTLGALAEIEALCPPGETLGAGRLLLIVEVLARGGGEVISLDELKAAPIDIGDAAAAVADCLDLGSAP